MKRYFLICCCFLLFNSVWGQGRDELEMSRAVLQAEKKAIIAQHLQMTEEQSEDFWPVYDEYQLDMSKINTRYLNVLNEMAVNYQNLSNEQADKLMREMFAVKLERAKLNKKYRRKFEKALPTKKLASFYQLEHSLNVIIDYDVAQVIPLVED